ncbi:MAG: YifB family Mg chelatase-like AAA ATPase, partial [Pseudomonadota bacterium]|nr:YifB family Mg chelatase-like AAA ATPase [Pseudomonadota bacterium]
MSLARLQSRAPNGLDAPPVSVEIHLSGGLPSFTIVGLPEAAVRESRERVRSALINSGFDFPARRITANLAPADIPKQGGRFDLPIALGILAASGQIKPVATDLPGEYLGELGLGGELRSVTGVLPSVLAAKALNHTVMLPEANCAEASLVEGASLLATQSLIQAAAHLSGSVAITEKTGGQSSPQPQHQYAELDLSDVCGQSFGVRSLEIAAAGGHSLMMVGPPGCGKTMLAERLAGILPDMSPSEALATAAVYSVSYLGFDRRHWQRRPFRAPHHSASAAALVGAGPRVAPGEISLAHNGVLFLDELTEFSR